jgi:flavin-dependent dehydrogenase
MAADGQYDVAVIGGGVSGLAAAVQISQQRPQTRIVVIEKRSHPVPPTAHKVGEALAELSSHYYANVLGMREYLEESHLRKMGLRWFMTANGNDDLSRRVEFGLSRFSPLPTFQIDRGEIENKLASMAAEHGVEFRDSTSVSDVELGDEHHTLTLGRGDEAEQITARWVLDASGRQALLRNKLGVGVDMPITASASWFRTPYRLMVDEWCDDPAWRAQVPTGTRWKSTCSFVGQGYWSWVINLGSGSASVGVVADPDYVSWDKLRRYDALKEWLEGVEPQLAEHLPDTEDGLLDFNKRKNFSHTCRRAYSRNRWALTGEAALFVDPLYSTGHDTAAVGNTLATDLICRELDGESGRELTQRVRAHNRALLGLVQGMTNFFPGALGMYGHAQATAAKLLWDNVMYFSIGFYLFRTGSFTNPEIMRTLQADLKSVIDMNAFMQAEFREWARWGDRLGDVDVPNIGDFLFEHLVTAPEDVSPDEVYAFVRGNVARLQTIVEEVVGHMREAAGEPPPEYPYDPPATTSGEDLVIWSDWARRSGEPALRDTIPEDGWLIR